ncbi:MAG: helix-turn-helix domain-containing protein [Verrucomicrobiae bacterium]|nr:helix-turn-helix domain-containing protein [Verrucomicrobiae bacterium]
MTISSRLAANRLKSERRKRSWTQEYLAEKAGLSVRTIQRLERGEEPNLETLRLVADALGIPAKELETSPLRTSFRSPWSLSLKVITGFSLFFLLGVGIYARFHGHPWTLEGVKLLILACLALSVRGVSMKEGQLLIHRIGWSTRLPLAAIRSVEVNPEATMGSIRLFGIGGLFAYVGWYRNDLLGSYRAYATDFQKTVVIRFADRTIVVTPDDPAEFSDAVGRMISTPVAIDQK